MCLDYGDHARRTNGGKPLAYSFSGFVVEIDGRWIFVTAGHVFTELEAAKAKGAIIKYWHLDDSSVSPNPQAPYPIDLRMEDVFFTSEDTSGMDYAAFEIRSPMAKTALSGQGIVPIQQEQWDVDGSVVSEFPSLYLVGTPAHLTKTTFGDPVWERYIVTIPVDIVVAPPQGIKETAFTRLYGEMRMDLLDSDSAAAVKDIGGMSGGPIFGLKNGTVAEDFEYRVVALQSSWNKRGGIAACAVAPFLNALKQNLSPQLG